MAACGSSVAIVLQGATDTDRGAVWFSRYDHDGWTDLLQIASVAADTDGRLQCWDPALHVDATGAPHVFFTTGAVGEGRPRALSGMVCKGEADGTFSAPRDLPEGILGPTRSGSGVSLQDGTVLFGAEDEALRIEATKPPYEEWRVSAKIPDEDSLEPKEPSLCQYEGRGVMLCRSGCGEMVEVWSERGFREWTKPRRSTLPNPRSKVEGITLADGRLFLVYNHTHKGRTPLNVAVYEEDLWHHGFELASGEGRFSMPAAAQADDGDVHVVFTDNSNTRF